MCLRAGLRRFGVGSMICVAAVLFSSASAFAQTKSFTKAGCEAWKVPAGVSSVAIQATGAAGGKGEENKSLVGGKGDGYSATLSGLTPGEELFVCVDQGGGEGGSALGAVKGGSGGGASGVSRGKNFEAPVLVSGGGGGDGAASLSFEGDKGGDAGKAGGENPSATGGGGATESEAGKGGVGGFIGEFSESGKDGAKFSSAGPGIGGAGGIGGGDASGGGGGGGGYFGGGGGAGGVPGAGGGGGSDFCKEEKGVSGCSKQAATGTKPEAGEAEGDAKVTLTYTVVQTATSTTTSLSGEGKKGQAITVTAGEAVTDHASIAGTNASSAEGSITYNVYSDSECTTLVRAAGVSKVTAGEVPASEPETLPTGTYYWQAVYSGDELNTGSSNICGSEVLTVTPKLFTCGKTTIGKFSDQLVANQKRVNKCVISINALMNELTVYLAPTSHAGEELIKGVLYGDSKGKPGERLAETSKLKFGSTNAAGWYHFVFLTPVKLTPGTYWMGIITGPTSKVAGERFDSVPKAEDFNTNSYSSGASKSFGSFKTTNEEMSLYATFEEERKVCAPIRGQASC
jgi:hypothetical protein